MSEALTADKREERIAEYLQYVQTLNRGQIGELKLTRMNRVANFRRALMQMMNAIIEARAEELAASWIEQFAPPRPPRKTDVSEGRLPAPKARRQFPR